MFWFGLCFLIIIGGVVYKGIIEPIIDSLSGKEGRFQRGEMTKDERDKYLKKKLRNAEDMYRHGDLSLLELELLRKEYTGSSTLLDNGGLAFTAAASRKDQVDRAITQQQKKAERDLIFQSSVGSAINGTAGAIIGAVNSAQKSSREAAALETQRTMAEQEYRKALDDLAKP